MYSVLDYGRMAADGVRMDAYARAIARAVKPGSVVLDLGCGTGIFSLLAVRAGARHVYAVDVNPAVWLIPELAAENGCADRVTIHHGSSTELELPEKVDVIVSDMRGTSPLNGDHVSAVRDARTRWLKPGGTLIPGRDRLFVQIVESEDLALRLQRGWQSFEKRGLSCKAARASILNALYDDRQAPLLASDLLSGAGEWSSLDYASYDGKALEGTVDLEVTRGGTAHGLTVWFEAEVFEDIAYRSAPGWSLAYARCYLPLLEPVLLTAGDHARITMRADARGSRWAWETTLTAADGTARARFRQSTFFGAPTGPDALLRSSATHRPVPGPKGERLRTLLAAMDGQHTVSELVQTVESTLPAHSPLRGQLVEEVRDAITCYAR
ncbi:MAG TPA: class I SAM-dependent methyltransferase [Labilithrix sp.]|nr:class I SAM-dependent methyltransferase [Labilithrix sp.]